MSGVADLGERRDLRAATAQLAELNARLLAREREATRAPAEFERLAIMSLVDLRSLHDVALEKLRPVLTRLLATALAMQHVHQEPANLSRALDLALGLDTEALAEAMRTVLRDLPADRERLEKLCGGRPEEK
jgi:hypothetical protein